MKTFILKGLAGAGLLALASCAPTSPAGRIDRNPEIYDSLPAKQQQEVRDGRISRGMSYEAVLLAWGRPARRIEQMRAEGPVVRWDYTGTQPVYTNHFYGGYGRGYHGRYGRYSRTAIGFGPQIDYVPYHRASVWFVDGRVDAWESVR